MARSKEFDTNAVLDAAIEVFRCKGYEAASVQDLVEEMGINRGSLYDTFGDKHALFLACLDRYDQRKYEEACALLQPPPDAPIALAVKRYYARIIDQALLDDEIGGDPFGCLMTNSSMERAPIDPATATRTALNWSRRESLFFELLLEGRVRGEITGEDAQLRARARFYLGVAKGLRVAVKACPRRDVLEDIARIALETLET